MKTRTHLAAATQLLLIFPALLFMGSLVVRNLSPLQYGPAQAAQQIVLWYAGRMWTLWVLLIALPIGVLITGCVMFAGNYSRNAGLPQFAKQALALIRANGGMSVVAVLTLTAVTVLIVVFLHMLAN